MFEAIDNPPKTLKGMRRAINYITNPKKTKEHLISGILCSPNNNQAYIEMLAIKQSYNKVNDGKSRQVMHFTQSFSPHDKIIPEQAHEIGKRLIKECSQFRDFQIIMSTHIDREHIHNHFIINTVNTQTGIMWHKSKQDLQEIKDYSDKLCREYGLIVIPKTNNQHRSSGEYRSKQNGTSWKYELFIAVNNCLRNSTSKDDFISNMKKLGYGVNWTDENKYITFITPNGRKCRNKKLYPAEKFTKENMLKTFELNKRYASKKQLDTNMNLLTEAVSLLNQLQDEPIDIDHRYPLTRLEGQALKEKIIELKNSTNMKWDKGNGYER